LTTERDRAPGQGSATKNRQAGQESVTASSGVEVTLALRALAQGAARAAYAASLTVEESAALSARAVGLVTRALELLQVSDVEVMAVASASVAPADGLPLQPADTPNYRAARPPGAGATIEIDERGVSRCRRSTSGTRVRASADEKLQAP
jgi:hypothetical protein